MIASKKNFDISKLVEHVYELHSFAAAKKGLRYTFSVSHKVPRMLYGDEASIKQALSVITGMAIEDTSDGSVELNVDLQNDHGTTLIVKFCAVESSKQTPYWFSVSLEPSKSKKTA